MPLLSCTHYSGRAAAPKTTRQIPAKPTKPRQTGKPTFWASLLNRRQPAAAKINMIVYAYIYTGSLLEEVNLRAWEEPAPATDLVPTLTAAEFPKLVVAPPPVTVPSGVLVTELLIPPGLRTPQTACSRLLNVVGVVKYTYTYLCILCRYAADMRPPTGARTSPIVVVRIFFHL